MEQPKWSIRVTTYSDGLIGLDDRKINASSWQGKGFRGWKRVARSNGCWSARISAECMFLIQGRGRGQEREAQSVNVFVSDIEKALIVAGSKGLALSVVGGSHSRWIERSSAE